MLKPWPAKLRNPTQAREHDLTAILNANAWEMCVRDQISSGRTFPCKLLFYIRRRSQIEDTLDSDFAGMERADAQKQRPPDT